MWAIERIKVDEMNSRNLEKALDIVSALITGRNVDSKSENAGLYEEYQNNSEVYDMAQTILKKMNLELYEYNNGLYISPGENNKTFGYTNEELKKAIGVKLNRELYLCYFIIYNIITRFYNDSANYTYVEYVKQEDVIASVDSTLSGIISKLSVLALDEVEAGSFKELALVWEDMPIASSDDVSIRASRGSKSGFVKLVFNFLTEEGLMLESEGRYYPKDKFKALIENYFDHYKGRLYEILRGEEDNATH